MRSMAKWGLALAASVPWFTAAGSIARGEVTDITGSSSATVIEFLGLIPVQTDFGQVIVPLTLPVPPAVSRARLDRVDDQGATTAGGQAVAVFDLPDIGGGGPPNDVGLDLAAFSEDESTGWLVLATANETRKIVLGLNEVSSGPVLGAAQRTRGRVILSGVLVITASNVTKDLSGVEAHIQISVNKLSFGQFPTTLLQGEVTLAGGPNGSVTIVRATGAFEGLFLPVVDFSGTVPDLPLARAVLFVGLELPYEYDVDVGQPFELDLAVSSRLLSTPGGTGAAAVFGLPQEGLGSILQRIKKDDRGQQLANVIAQQVDTTGAAYANGGGTTGLSLTNLFPLCGTIGSGSVGMMLMSCFVVAAMNRRRRPVFGAMAMGRVARE